MHEMGIIIHLAKTLDQVAEENHLSKIGAVTIEIGEVSGIVTDLFEDAWNYFSKKHPVLTGSELRIETIPAVTHCEGCGENYETVAYGRPKYSGIIRKQYPNTRAKKTSIKSMRSLLRKSQIT